MNNNDRPDELNKGFSLVELVIVIAILAIVGLILGTLITTGINLYQRQNKDLNLQTRSQLLQSQITTYITNADLGLYMPEGADESSSIFAVLSIDNEYYKSVGSAQKQSDFENGTIHARAAIIAYDSEQRKIYYVAGAEGSADGIPVIAEFEDGKVKKVTITDSESMYSDDMTTWPVLSDYVSDFKVKVVDDAKVVNVEMALEYSERIYTYDFTVALRNDTSLYGPKSSEESEGSTEGSESEYRY